MQGHHGWPHGWYTAQLQRVPLTYTMMLYQAGEAQLRCITSDPTISLTSSNKDFFLAHPVCPSRLALMASLQPPD